MDVSVDVIASVRLGIGQRRREPIPQRGGSGHEEEMTHSGRGGGGGVLGVSLNPRVDGTRNISNAISRICSRLHWMPVNKSEFLSGAHLPGGGRRKIEIINLAIM